VPLQNRVTPFGEIEAAPARGLFMGNRGILHDEHRRLGRARWRHNNWVTCLLAFKNRRREVMAPGRYTELFFCDEAVALAAGHRPCAECRREDYERFKQAWRRGSDLPPNASLPAAKLDAVLHRARVRRDRSQVCFESRLEELPEGAFVSLADRQGAWLLKGSALHRWSHDGYQEREDAREIGGPVMVLTPEPTVRALRAGYQPMLHAMLL
jgi:hypothetical protein